MDHRQRQWDCEQWQERAEPYPAVPAYVDDDCSLVPVLVRLAAFVGALLLIGAAVELARR